MLSTCGVPPLSKRCMKPISFKRHRFPPDVIRLGIWLYYRFTLSLRDVEDLLAERGIDVTYETVRCWANKFGPAIAANIRRRRGRADSVWHLDEMVVRINGVRMYMWRAVDKEGEGDCQDFRVWAGIMGEKESHYVPTQGAGDSG